MRFPENARKSDVAAYIVGLGAFRRTLLRSRFGLLFMMDAGCLLKTLPTEFASAQEATVELNGDGFTGFSAPQALVGLVIRGDQSFH